MLVILNYQSYFNPICIFFAILLFFFYDFKIFLHIKMKKITKLLKFTKIIEDIYFWIFLFFFKIYTKMEVRNWITIVALSLQYLRYKIL